jgi:O-antigen ligase
MSVVGLRPSSRLTERASLAGQAGLALFGGVVVAFLIASGRWYLAVACLLAVPAYIFIDRYPFAVVSMWIVLAPLVAVTESTSTRKLFWIVHRGLPLATLLLLVFGALLGMRARRLPRLGPAELLMAGYVVATLLSIAYTSVTPKASAYHLYDAVVIPMCLYLLVRLVEPDEAALRAFVPAVMFLLVTQAAIGIAAWAAPGALPSEWLGKAGARTTGSLRSPDVYGAVAVFAGLFLLASAVNERGYVRRLTPMLLFLLAIFMAFLTYSRASWLAGIFAVVGVACLARGAMAQIAVVLVPLALLLAVSGLLNSQVEFAQTRLESEQSDESALSRLPVAYASIRMFEAKPIFGFGYENFNRFDYQYQQRVGNLVYPSKDHSSHNLYLTILAEQGLVGIVLYLGPAFWWLGRTKSRWRNLPRSGLLSRNLVGFLWFAIGAHFIVNNFSRMHVPFGLGVYWLSLALIAAVLSHPATKPQLATEATT